MRTSFLLFLLLGSSLAKDIYVSPDGNDSNRGSINEPLQTITEAVSVAPAGSTIFLAAGTYTEPETIEITKPLLFTTTSGLRDVFVLSNDWIIFRLNNTSVAISMLIFGDGVEVDNSFLTLTSAAFSDCSTSVLASNSSITAINSSFAQSSSAIYASGGTVDVKGCSFSVNSGYSGAVLFISSDTSAQVVQTEFFQNLYPITNEGDLVIDRCKFVQNKRTSISNFGNLTISESTFSANQADDCAAIFNTGTLDIDTSSFTKHQADYGGVLCNYGKLRVSSCMFSSNSAWSMSVLSNSGVAEIRDSLFELNSGRGGIGAISNEQSLNISGCSFTSNSAYTVGGAIASRGPILNVTNSNFISNSAELGGAIFSETIGFSVVGGAITGNTAEFGGAMYLSSTESTVSDCMITKNTVKYEGAALYFDPKGLFNATSVWNSCTFDCNCANTTGSLFFVGSGSQLFVDCTIAVCLGEELALQVGGVASFIGGTIGESICSAD